MLYLLMKSHIKQHLRHNATGSVSVVKEHDDSRHVMFRPQGARKLRRGVIVGTKGNHFKVLGLRDEKGQRETFLVPKDQILTVADYEKQKSAVKAGKTTGDKIGAHNQISAEEGVRRKESGMKRLGMTEDEVMETGRVKGFIISEANAIARTNEVDHADRADLISEFTVGALTALRKETADAPKADLKEFKEHITEQRSGSRIFASMASAGKGAAIRFIKRRNEERRMLVDPHATENPAESVAYIATPAHQEKDYLEKVEGDTIELKVAKVVDTLPEPHREILQRKFGIGAYDPQTGEEIAAILNDRGQKFGDKYKWTRNHVGTVFNEALQKLREADGVDSLKDFMKSLRELVLMKSVKVYPLSDGRTAYLPLVKSFSSDLAQKYPDGKWITVKQGPLEGRHVFIVPHKDGTASVLAGGGPAMKHKVLGLRKEEPKEPTAAEKQETAKKETAEIPEEKKTEIKAAQKQKKQEIADERKKMADIVRQHLGHEVEITDDERKAIEKKVEGIADPKQKAVTRLKELNSIRKEKDDLMHQVAAEAKKAILDEETQGKGSIAAVVKEHAEDLLNHYYRIKSLERENQSLAKMVRSGKEIKRPLHDDVKFEPLTKKDLEGIITDEKARAAELDAHYKLIKTARGGKGGSEIERNVRQGGYEALTGIMGELTGSSILKREVYDELGPQNAAVLAHYFVKNSGLKEKEVAAKIAKEIENVSADVAVKAVATGDRFLETAKQVMAYGRGDDNLMSAAQALGTSLKYQNKAFEAYGQAEGSLNQAAELVYELKNDKGAIEIHAKSKDTLERKRKKLGLKAADVRITKIEESGDYRMVIPEKSFEKLIHETPTAKSGITGEVAAADIKALKANTDDFRPSMINEYTPEDKTGKSQKIVLKPEQQAGARLVAKQKRVYLNFEAGVGKSLTILAAKAHAEDETGKPVKMIIAMPQKLMSNFKDEVEKFSGYKVAIVDDSNKKARAAKYAADPNTIVVVNKEKFNFDKALIRDAKFDMVVADEAHKITQREGRSGSDMSRGLRDIAKEAPYYVAMSGTPTPDDLSQLYFHAHVMNPEKFSSQKQFMAQFGSVHKGVGLKDQIAAFMNRELGDHVYTVKKQLDTKFTLHTHMADLHPKQKEAYRNVSEQSRTKAISPLQRDQQLNGILNGGGHTENGKFGEIKKIVDSHLAKKGADEKVIFYAKNYDTVDTIKDFLKTHYGEHEIVTFTGKEKVKDIRANKDRFKHDSKVKFAIHTRAGVEGLNLQYDGNGGGATTAVAVASGEDSFAPLDQFFSRANRTGAKRDIDAHLVLTDTPHDLGTELRLQEKRRVGELIKSRLFLLKRG